MQYTFTRLPPTQWRSVRTTNAIERLHEEFKRRIKTQTVLQSADTAVPQHWSIKGAAMTRVTMIILVALLLIMPAQAQPLPYPKGSGQCASDYVQSGSTAHRRMNRAIAAIPKVGACPSGWAQSGSACQRDALIRNFR
jgi:Transposase, Mutator family